MAWNFMLANSLSAGEGQQISTSTSITTCSLILWLSTFAVLQMIQCKGEPGNESGSEAGSKGSE